MAECFFAGMTEYFPDFVHCDSLPPSETLISLRTTEKQCLVAHDIYLIINKSAVKACEVGGESLAGYLPRHPGRLAGYLHLSGL